MTQGYSDAALDLICTRGKDLAGHDQAALNVAIANKWAELPLQWNYQYHFTTMLWAVHFDVCLYHFSSSRKPFYSKYGAYARRFTTPYRRFLQQHFPDLVAQVRDGLAGPGRRGFMIVVALFNLRKLRGILQMEAKFDGDFDIRPIIRPKAEKSQGAHLPLRHYNGAIGGPKPQGAFLFPPMPLKRMYAGYPRAS